ncbi:MAG: DUF799 family lipoprotein, partial [Elusimicrobia bacterium]|nr:DUF799 family lipoprotein [Elusimicrobiota bacterium]
MPRSRLLRALCCASIAAVSAGCARGTRPDSPRLEGRTVALLPMDNRSNDLRAPEKARDGVFEAMGKSGYRVLDLAAIDQAMDSLGVHYGGQLSAVPLGSLREALAADVYCYGTVVEYGFKSAVALTQRKVELRLRCVDPGGGPVFDGSGV